jgi:hypothetical protein
MKVFQNLTQDRSTSMTDEAMSPLRRRMIEDMTIRKLAPKTQQGYIRTIKDFAVFLGRSPDTASFEDVRRFQLHLAESGAHPPIPPRCEKHQAAGPRRDCHRTRGRWRSGRRDL